MKTKQRLTSILKLKNVSTVFNHGSVKAANVAVVRQACRTGTMDYRGEPIATVIEKITEETIEATLDWVEEVVKEELNDAPLEVQVAKGEILAKIIKRISEEV